VPGTLRGPSEGGSFSKEDCVAVRLKEEEKKEAAESVASSLLTEPPLSCSQLAQKAREGHLIGAFVPQCQEDGAFAARQCHSSTGYCWCSSASGRQVPGTLRGPSEGGSFSKEDCVAVRLKEEEKKEAAESVASSLLTEPPLSCSQLAQKAREGHLIGAFVPQCQEDGAFAARQCHGSTGYCWCSSASGRQLRSPTRDGSVSEEDCTAVRHAEEDAAEEDQEDEEEEEPASSCRELAQKALDLHLIGSYVPQCQEDGAFAARQCHGSTGYCWCSSASGRKVPGTLRSPTAEGGSFSEEDCAAAASLCGRREPRDLMREACALPPGGVGNCMLHMRRYHFNATSRRCEEYTMAGCHGSANDFDTRELCLASCGAGSAPPEEAPAHADGGGSTCRESLETAQRLEGRGVLGVFHPRCTEEMEWQAMQCHKYGCWCVDESGTAFSGVRLATVGPERSSMEQFQSSCDSLRRTCEPCQLASQEKCTEEHQAKGVNCIVGACVERAGLHAAVDK